MREKIEKLRQKKTNEPVASVNNLIPPLAALHDLHRLIDGQYNKVNFPKYHLTIDEANHLADKLIEKCLKTDDKIQFNYFKKIIIGLLYYLSDGDFDIVRHEQSNNCFKDSQINHRMHELCTILALKPEAEIKLILEYLFNLKNISLDSDLRKQINVIVEILHNGKIGELSNRADLSIPFKSDVLSFIKLLNFPYKSETAKMNFYIQLLGGVYLEISEGAFSLFNKNNPEDDSRKLFIKPVEAHPFLEYKNYNAYVNSRYKTIAQFLKNKTNSI